MKNAALKTLFIPFENGAVQVSGKGIFMGAMDDPYFVNFSDLDRIQYWANINCRNALTQVPAKTDYDYALCLIPKQKEEALGMLANAAKSLKESGTLIAAASNDANGGRLVKWMKDLGSAPQSLSKHKARVIWAGGPFNQNKIDEWIENAAPRQIEMNGQSWHTQPGIFGWDKIDAGSKLLAAHLPENLSGDVADFGCGYGYLTRALLTKNAASVTAIDADSRALSMCAQNVPQAKMLHADLTAPQDLGQFDAVVMNPPFHSGRESDVDIGLAFIQTAYAHLKKGGALYMVANAHLPYEKALATLFKKTEKIIEAEGFKIFKAAR